MSTPQDPFYDENLKVFTVCAGILWSKMVQSNLMVGKQKFVCGERAPEDDLTHLVPSIKKQGQGQHEDAKPHQIEMSKRAQRIVGNDLENIPVSLILAQACKDLSSKPIFYYSMIVFTIARLCHTVCYENKIFGARATCWFAGVLSVGAMCASAVQNIYTK